MRDRTFKTRRDLSEYNKDTGMRGLADAMLGALIGNAEEHGADTIRIKHNGLGLPASAQLVACHITGTNGIIACVLPYCAESFQLWERACATG